MRRPFCAGKACCSSIRKELEDGARPNHRRPALSRRSWPRDPSARGLFAALALLGKGVKDGQVDLSPYRTALTGVPPGDGRRPRRPPASAVVGAAARWQARRAWAGPYKFVLAQPVLDHGVLEPGGAATAAIRAAASKLEFVEAGDARVRITGSVALSDEEFATVAQGRRRRHDRQRPADHAVAVPGGPVVAPDRADPVDARARADADPAVRGRGGRHA